MLARHRSLFSALHLATLGALAMAPLVGCVADDATLADDPAGENESALVAAHAYQRPPTPTANYEPPATNVVFVAPTGNDGAAGTSAAPYATLGKAIAVVDAKPAGATWTIVLRGGTYREGELTVTRNNVTIQRYKSELVTLLGSTRIANFTGSGPYSATVTAVDPTRVEQSCADGALLAGDRHYGSETAIHVTRAGVPLQRVSGSSPASGQ